MMGLSLGKGTLLGTGYIKVTADTSEAESRLGGLGTALGVGVAGLGALAAAGAATVTMANDFNNKMLLIQTQAGGTAKDVRYLSNAVLSLKDVQQSPNQLADALYHLKSVGLDNVTAMKDLKIASQLASVGNSDLEATTNALAGAWRSGIKGAQDMGQAAATVNAIIGAGNMRMTDFVSAISTGILPSAKTFGLSLQSVGAAMALMTDEGIPAVDAATRLRTSFSLMGAPSKAAEKQLKLIGLTGLQLADAMRGPQGIIGAIQLLKDHLDASGMSASQQAALLSRAFGGGRSNSAILTMLNNLDVLKKKQDQINKSMGAFPDAVKAQQQTLSAQIKIMENNLQDIGIKVGEALIGPVTWFVSFLNATAVPAITRFFQVVTKALPVQSMGSGLTAFMKSFAGVGAVTSGAGVLGSAGAPPSTINTSFLNGTTGVTSPRMGMSHDLPALPAAPTGMAAMGQEIRQVFTGQLVPDLRDVAKFLGDIATSARNLFVAIEPLLADLAGIGLKTLDAVASILAHQLGPALVAVTNFIKDNRAVFDILITVYLTPLLIRLTALSAIRSITAVAGLAKDVAMFPINNLGKIIGGIKDFAAPGGALDGLRLHGMNATQALKDFGGKIKDLGSAGWDILTTNASKIGGALKNAGQAGLQMGQDILTGIKMYGAQAWAGAVAGVGKLKDAVLALRDSELLATVAEKAQALWAGIVMGAEKVWTVVQAALDFVLDANPIALVVIALAMLAAGLVYAYQHSATFRDIVQGAFHVIADAAKFMWNDVLKPTFRFLLDTFLSVAGGIIDGAAKMFGWVPGIGGMLKGAAKAFDGFASDVNSALGGIQSKTVPVTITFNGVPQGSINNHTYTSTTGWSYADGGPITGGVAGKDSVPILAMPGEHMWTAAEVQAAGGHQAMYAMRSAVRANGGVKKYANGGPVYHGLSLGTSMPADTASVNYSWQPLLGEIINNTVHQITSDYIKGFQQAAAQAGTNNAGGFAGAASGAAQTYAQSLLASYGWGPNQMGPLINLWNQESGWRWNALNPSSGAYGIPQALPADKMASAGSDWQTNYQTQIRWGLGYIAGRYGSPASAWAHEMAYNWYDDGGLARGRGLLAKYTQQPERVLSPRQTASFDRLVDVLDHGGAGGGIELHAHFHGPVGSSAELEDWLVRALTSIKRNNRLRTIIPGT